MSERRRRRQERKGWKRTQAFMAVTAFMISLWQFVISDPVSGPWFASLWKLISGNASAVPEFAMNGAAILCGIGPVLAVPYFIFFSFSDNTYRETRLRLYLPGQIIEPSFFWLIVTARDWLDLVLMLFVVLLGLLALISLMSLFAARVDSSADVSALAVPGIEEH
ncbi:hypothetical protein ABZU32_20620 [Sphaerisporangium sp. NPDC005288]|uniref:hypothetical protein n=1 Tax=Sphaerisporangium sp. NPDC005288 TaxID=3155114 RepID=UPI0033AC8E7F